MKIYSKPLWAGFGSSLVCGCAFHGALFCKHDLSTASLNLDWNKNDYATTVTPEPISE